MTDKVQKIREEVKRLMHNHDSALDYEAALEDVRNFIDSLQEEPKFKIGDVVRFKGNETIKGEEETHKIVGYDNELYIFDDGTTDLFCEQELYELVKEPISEELEKAAHEYADNADYVYADVSIEDFTVQTFKAGAKWQKEQMAKNALEADREEFPDGTFIYSTKNMIVDDMEWRGITDLDNVKIILYGLS